MRLVRKLFLSLVGLTAATAASCVYVGFICYYLGWNPIEVNVVFPAVAILCLTLLGSYVCCKIFGIGDRVNIVIPVVGFALMYRFWEFYLSMLGETTDYLGNVFECSFIGLLVGVPIGVLFSRLQLFFNPQEKRPR